MYGHPVIVFNKICSGIATIVNKHASVMFYAHSLSVIIVENKINSTSNTARMGEGRGVHRVLVGRSEGKSPLGRPRRRWEDNIKMELQEV
jgi:hypothetical protein